MNASSESGEWARTSVSFMRCLRGGKKLRASRKKFLIRARNSLQFIQEEKRTARRSRVASPSLRKPRALLKSISDEKVLVFSAVDRSGKREVPVLRGAANLARGFRDCQSNLPGGGDRPHASEEEGRQEEHQ